MESCPHRPTGEPVNPIDEQLKTTVLGADKREGTDLKQIGRIRVEWAEAAAGQQAGAGCVPVGGERSDI